MIVLIVHDDPGHAWLETPKALIRQHGIHKQISSYSYQRGTNAYLETDCDAPLLINALEAAGIQYDLRRQTTDNESPIRNYHPYPCCALVLHP